MLRFKDMKFRVKLTLFSAVALTGLLIFGAVSYGALEKVRVGSALANELKMHQELGTDLAPPTLNIIQLRLVVRNMILRADRKDLERDLAEFRRLKKEFGDSNDQWNKALPDGQVKELATVKARQAGEEYIQ
jgi:hypothetical protein